MNRRQHRKYNLVEFFSGIGSQAKALKNLGIIINTLGTCEWDVHAIAAYDLIHTSGEIPRTIAELDKQILLEKLKNYTFSNSGKEELDFCSLKTYSAEALRRIFTSVLRNKNHVDISKLSGSEMSGNVDILTYSFPCQDLSNVGAFHGYKKGIDKGSGSRSSLLWEVGRILSEMHAGGKKLPRFLLMENVPALLSKRHIGNFNTWISDLEALGYISKYFQLNACSFGLPQNRPRLLMISVYVGENETLKKLVNSYFESKDENGVVRDYYLSRFYHKYSVSDLLRTDYSNPGLLAEAIDCTPNDTVSRRKIWNDNPQLVLHGNTVNTAFTEIRTITTKQDRNPNSGNLYFDSGIEGKSKFRYLTPRECMLFMGFTDDDYLKLKKHNLEFHRGDGLFSRDKIIRMAGNSIPVKLLEGIFFQIEKIDNLLGAFRKTSTSAANTATENKDGFDSLIYSYLLSKGIQSRLTGECYPDDADIVYPQYHTAIYLQSCAVNCHNGQKCFFTSEHRSIIFKKGCQAGKKAVDMGWNALIVRHCDLKTKYLKDTLLWIENCIQFADPASRGVKGQILIRG